jgi:ParB-like chromosome segregation protein Spo0J
MEPTPKISIHYRKLDELKPADYNPRRMTKEQATALQASIERYGIIDPIIVNTFPGREGVIVGGHQRYEIAKLLAIDEIPCVDVYLDEAKEKELNLRLNKNLGEWDWEKLANYFDIPDLVGVGFSDEELKMQLGLNDAGEQDFDAERANVLQVVPPESVRLRERLQIEMGSKEDYDLVKKAVDEGRITVAMLIEKANGKA